jgi:hypothetical protein
MTAMFAEFFKSAWEIIKKGKKTQDSPVEAMAE